MIAARSEVALDALILEIDGPSGSASPFNQHLFLTRFQSRTSYHKLVIKFDTYMLIVSRNLYKLTRRFKLSILAREISLLL